MSARNFTAPEFLTAGLGDVTALCRLTDEITALNKHLAAQGRHFTRRELLDLQDNLNTLALFVARIKSLVSERIAVLTAGGFNGD